MATGSDGIILAFDFGTKKTGCAIGNTLTRTARPLCVIRGESNDKRFGDIEALIKEWTPSSLVVGIPYHPDGAEHEMTHRARRFSRQLNGRFGLPVALVDERYTSALAGAQPGEEDDALAASLILEQYFNESAD